MYLRTALNHIHPSDVGGLDRGFMQISLFQCQSLAVWVMWVVEEAEK